MELVQLRLFHPQSLATVMMMHPKTIITVATIPNKTFAQYFAMLKFLS